MYVYQNWCESLSVYNLVMFSTGWTNKSQLFRVWSARQTNLVITVRLPRKLFIRTRTSFERIEDGGSGGFPGKESWKEGRWVLLEHRFPWLKFAGDHLPFVPRLRFLINAYTQTKTTVLNTSYHDTMVNWIMMRSGQDSRRRTMSTSSKFGADTQTNHHFGHFDCVGIRACWSSITRYRGYLWHQV